MTERTPSDPLRTDEALERRLGHLGLEFQARFHEIALRHRGDDPEILAELGHAYTRLGRFQEGLSIDRRLAGVAPDNATVHYNLACSLCLCGQHDASLDALERSAELGYDDADHLEADEDLSGLRSLERFGALVEQLRAAP